MIQSADGIHKLGLRCRPGLLVGGVRLNTLRKAGRIQHIELTRGVRHIRQHQAIGIHITHQVHTGQIRRRGTFLGIGIEELLRRRHKTGTAHLLHTDHAAIPRIRRQIGLRQRVLHHGEPIRRAFVVLQLHITLPHDQRTVGFLGLVVQCCVIAADEFNDLGVFLCLVELNERLHLRLGGILLHPGDRAEAAVQVLGLG